MPPFTSQFAQTGFVLAVLAVVFTVCFSLKKIRERLPAGLIMIFAAAGGALADGWTGADLLRHLFEGEFYFLNLMMIIPTGMLMVEVFNRSGMLDVLTRTLIRRFHRWPSILLCLLMLIIMFPGMVTGSAPAAVLSTGVIVAPILMKMGIPRIETAAILAMGSIAGQQAPPVNVPIMIIATSVFMPYEGFTIPLAALNFPLGFFSILWIGRRHVSVEGLREVAKEPAKPGTPEPSLLLYLPLVLLVLFMAAPRFLPKYVPDVSTPLIFMLISFLGLFTGKRFSFWGASKHTFDHALEVIVLFAGIGVLVQVMALTGVRGLIAVTTISLPRYLLYSGMSIVSILLPGVLVTFGAAAVLGPPFILSLADVNSIILSSGTVLLMGLGCLVPPTGIGGLFAMRVVGEKSYWPIFKRCIVPALYALVVGLTFMLFADKIATIPGFRYRPVGPTY